MRNCGIVCEYNPFHNGHKRQFDILRNIGVDTIICVMSGNFTQRGELSIFDKYTRAEAAIKCGADIVVELPYPYSSSSAERFSSAGTYILNALGCDSISFGSENLDLDSLYEISKAAASDEFVEYLKKEKDDTEEPGKDYFSKLSMYLGKDLSMLESNDILAIEYLKSIIKSNYDMNIIPIKREGAKYIDKEFSVGEFQSARAIRDSIFSGELSDICEYIPREAYKVFDEKSGFFNDVFCMENIEESIISILRLMSLDENIDLSNVADYSEDLFNRILKKSRYSRDYISLLSNVRTKKYTESRIKRAILAIVFGAKSSILNSNPAFVTLLGASKKGCEYLSENKKKITIPIITKPADIRELGDKASEQSALDKKANSIYTMGNNLRFDSDYFIKMKPYIEKGL